MKNLEKVKELYIARNVAGQAEIKRDKKELVK